MLYLQTVPGDSFVFEMEEGNRRTCVIYCGIVECGATAEQLIVSLASRFSSFWQELGAGACPYHNLTV
jgi:hypothetical protein